MIYIFWIAAGFFVGGIIAWLLAASHTRHQLGRRLEESERRANIAEGRASGLDGTVAELRAQNQRAAEDFEKLRSKLEAEHGGRVKAETQLAETIQRLEEERKLLEEAKSKLTDTFKAVAGDTLDSSTSAFLKLAKETFDKVLAEAKGDLGKRQEAIQGLVKPLSDSLKQFEEHIRTTEKNRQEAYSGLTEQLKAISTTQQQLQKETGNLVVALRTPKTVGSWGQIALERVVELSGMSEHCDFTREVSVTTEEGRLRPDLIVHLPGEREIVIDAKATFDAYREAVAAEKEEQRNKGLAQHAAQIRSHMVNLASKNYWQQFEKAPEFVVMFIPGESFFAAAVDVDRGLLEEAIEKRVVLATPTTLIALLRAVAFGWRQEQIAKNAKEISDLGKQLYERMRTLAEHLTEVGRGLEKANTAYNSAVGSMEARILPAARRFKELGAASGTDISVLEPVDTAPRAISTPELKGGTETDSEGRS
jgi:DNA recombination protein RmuC